MPPPPHLATLIPKPSSLLSSSSSAASPVMATLPLLASLMICFSATPTDPTAAPPPPTRPNDRDRPTDRPTPLVPQRRRRESLTRGCEAASYLPAQHEGQRSRELAGRGRAGGPRVVEDDRERSERISLVSRPAVQYREGCCGAKKRPAPLCSLCSALLAAAPHHPSSVRSRSPAAGSRPPRSLDPTLMDLYSQKEFSSQKRLTRSAQLTIPTIQDGQQRGSSLGASRVVVNGVPCQQVF